jgi:hypothetical protein
MRIPFLPSCDYNKAIKLKIFTRVGRSTFFKENAMIVTLRSTLL